MTLVGHMTFDYRARSGRTHWVSVEVSETQTGSYVITGCELYPYTPGMPRGEWFSPPRHSDAALRACILNRDFYRRVMWAAENNFNYGVPE